VLDRTGAERFARAYAAVLASAVADPTLAIDRLSAVDAAEAAQLRALSGLPAMRSRRFVSAVELILRAGAAHPDAIAVECAGRTLTYRELVARARTAAATLRDRLTRARGAGSPDGSIGGAKDLPGGIPRDTLIGLLLERSIDLPVAMIAVWMLGAAYVPLDPKYPRAVLEHAVHDSGLALLVTNLPDAAGFDGVPSCLLAEPAGATLDDIVALDPHATAYVIYTSGSTGKPKGVIVEHDQFSNFCAGMDQVVGGGRGDRWLAVTSSSFDISGLELVWTLTRGYHVIVARDARDALAAMDRRTAAPPTHLQCTPSLARMLLADEAGRRLLGDLDRLLVGGEALDRTLATRLDRVVRGSVINMYGPTETTIWSSCWAVGDGEVSLGAPIANTALYVLDAHGAEVPRGMLGELWIGGDGVARGYLRRPDLTAARFVPDPRRGDGFRMYRTGDLVRYRDDDSLEFCGRADHQIKLRGHRIELGEIDAVATAFAGVAECAAVVGTDVPDDPQLCLYWVAASAEVDPAALEAHLSRELPPHMVPSRLYQLAGLPHTPNGKIDRGALLAERPMGTPAPRAAATAGEAGAGLRALLTEVWREVLGVAEVPPDRGFFELGATSMTAVVAHRAIVARLGRELPLSALFGYPTIARLAAYLGDAAETTPVARRARRDPDDAIAIVGMACRVPGADDLAEYWRNLVAGLDTVARFSRDELRAAGIPTAALADPGYVGAKGIVPTADRFDAGFFDYSPGDAELIDPQHRVFLECAWEALEDAGLVPDRFAGRVAVFGGVGQWGERPAAAADLASYYRNILGGRSDFFATRVAHKLDLTGPAVNVQTACSTSLVAIHMARQAILRGEADAAIAGGVTLTFPIKHGYPYQPGLVVSPDGRCRPFDAGASGTVISNGAGVVVLRRVADALAGGDRIYAVLRGSAINNDGAAKVSFAAPSVRGQAEVIAAAYADAGITPDTISLVEAHGSGTALGDPIEVQALQQVFRNVGRAEPCALGSVKSNLGHLDTAAGVAGLIKAALCLRHAELVPSVHFTAPNPELRLESDLFEVVREHRPWRAPSGAPRRAGVSSFGMGGTNAHAVLEEAPAIARPATRPLATVPIVISARDERALRAQAAR
ncbi:MAG TPA: amino acid adenylation domain-containing protein, partial [Kofleriaceae bacterium]